MRPGALAGLLSGAAGTVALNVSTYLDMVVRGRPASEVPAQAAGELAERVGLPLDGEGDGTASNRRTGLGALLGYMAGLGVGAVYGSLRARTNLGPLLPTGLGLGLAAMMAGNAPSVAMGVTDPREWSVSGWMADLAPHLAYGLVTAAAYEAVTRPFRPTGWGLRA